MLMSAAEYRESLRAYRPRVFINGSAVESVAFSVRGRAAAPSPCTTWAAYWPCFIDMVAIRFLGMDAPGWSGYTSRRPGVGHLQEF